MKPELIWAVLFFNAPQIGVSCVNAPREVARHLFGATDSIDLFNAYSVLESMGIIPVTFVT